MAAPAFPLPLRNALADLALAAFDHADAAESLAWLARPTAPPPPAAATRLAGVHLIDPGESALLAVHAPWQDAVAAHAHRALHAATRGRAAGAPADEVDRALARAAALWDEGLFFEVHEVLEHVWQHAQGTVRVALQGLIQVAVAWHHLGHGNRRGARNLLRDGRERLAAAGHALPAIDAAGLLAATSPWADALAGGGELPPGGPPRLAWRPTR